MSFNEINLELQSLDDAQKQLEADGRQLEQAIRDASGTSAAESDADDGLLSNWLDTVNKKNRLIRREAELNFIVQHHDLEVRQADVEWQLREIMHQAESLKSDSDKQREEELLQELVTLVQERSRLVDRMDEERLRQQEEDETINEVLGSKFNQDVTSQDTQETSHKRKKKFKKFKILKSR